MHFLLRTILHVFLSKRQPQLSLWGRSSVKMRVWPWDIDIAGHINNGVYFTLMDIGRFDLMVRSGMFDAMRKRGWQPVVSAETIAFRKSLTLFTRYSMESRIVGIDEKSIYFEQCMVVKGEIYARAYMATRLVTKAGPVSNEDILAITGQPPADLELPEWAEKWRADTALPGSRKPAPFHI